MRARRLKGFTLVEILIVVVILGILAAIVVPQFTSASQEAVKGALASQLQTISSQVELYRVQNTGALPDEDADMPLGGADHNGWGVLVENSYLKGEPRNGFTRTSTVEAAGADPDVIAADTSASAAAAAMETGWFMSSVNGRVIANGYDALNNLLASEVGYAAPTFGLGGVEPEPEP